MTHCQTNHRYQRLQDSIRESLLLLCNSFWGPDEAVCRLMLSGQYLQPLCHLQACCSGSDLQESLTALQRFIQGYNDEKRLHGYLEETYVRLSINDLAGIRAPLYHSCHLDSQPHLMGPPALEMQARFERAGLSLDSRISVPPDHLCLELEYLYFLLEGHPSTGRLARIQEAVDFAGVFMLPWVTRFQERLLTGQGTEPYASLSGWLVGVIRRITEAASTVVED